MKDRADDGAGGASPINADLLMELARPDTVMLVRDRVLAPASIEKRGELMDTDDLSRV